jgi:NADH dehydrogenase FAD-containing subunit
LEATATEIDTIERTVKVLTVLCDDEDSCNLEEEFPINYDYLLTIFEAKTNTFGIPGVPSTSQVPLQQGEYLANLMKRNYNRAHLHWETEPYLLLFL